MTISIRMNPEDTAIVKEFAQLNNVSVSEFMRKTVMEYIEDQIDLRAYREAMAELKKNPKTYTHEEVLKMLEEDE